MLLFCTDVLCGKHYSLAKSQQRLAVKLERRPRKERRSWCSRNKKTSGLNHRVFLSLIKWFPATVLASCVSKTWNVSQSTFPPMRGRMCILPVWACFTDETMRQVPLRVTWRFDQRFTGSASFPFRTLNTPDSCTRSEPPTLRGLPVEGKKTVWQKQTFHNSIIEVTVFFVVVCSMGFCESTLSQWSSLSQSESCVVM